VRDWALPFPAVAACMSSLATVLRMGDSGAAKSDANGLEKRPSTVIPFSR